MEFFDSSVLVAAFWEDHVHHAPSFRRFAAAHKAHSACALHTLAELYAVVTRLPIRPMIPPEQALLFLDEVRGRLSTIALDADDYHQTIRAVADRGLTGGRIYDALLLRCAAKASAEVIYSWKVKHFRAVAPALAARIRTP